MRNGKSRSWLDRRHVMGVLAAGAAMVFASGAMAAPDEAARKLLPDDIKQKGVLIVGHAARLRALQLPRRQERSRWASTSICSTPIGDVLGLKTEIQRMGFASIDSGREGRARRCRDVGDGHPRGAPAARLVRALRPFQQRPDRAQGQPDQRPQRRACGAKIAVEKGTQPLFVWQKIGRVRCRPASRSSSSPSSTARARRSSRSSRAAPTRRRGLCDGDRRGQALRTASWRRHRAVRCRAAPWSAASPSPSRTQPARRGDEGRA